MNDSILATPINKSISILELISSGGTGGVIIMSLLALLSIVAVFILFENRFSIWFS